MKQKSLINPSYANTVFEYMEWEKEEMDERKQNERRKQRMKENSNYSYSIDFIYYETSFHDIYFN